jgi:hypothetical protein
MFTPPPSPLPAPFKYHGTPSVPSPPPSHQRSMSPAFNLSLPPPAKSPARERREHVLAIHDRKRRTGWRTYTIAIIFPLLLVLVTLSSRYFTLPRLVHLVAGIFRESRLSAASAAGARSISVSVHPLHRRQSGISADPSGIPAPTSTVSGILFPSQSTASSSIPPTPSQSVSSTVPTIPTSSPVLPTPFPQPFDTTLANNFTTSSCENFFTNMTQSLPFRQCRPFSFLSQTSSVFLQAQSNLTALNTDVWGTCNTPVDADQCASNMGWFSSNILVACSQEKSGQNQMVLQALAGLQLYSLMREVACTADPSLSVYCYVEAASSSNPSDMYFYSLPFGTPLPNNTTPTCSTCTKSIMNLFEQAVGSTDGLKQTYNSAAALTSSVCGSSYLSNVSSSSAVRWIGDAAVPRWTVLVILCATLGLL